MYFVPMISKTTYANVVTTIQSPTLALKELATMAHDRSELLYVIGDKKSPLSFTLPGAQYLSVQEQLKLNFKIIELLPWNSYTRKMLGYLAAAKAGCHFIRETDDDNFPLSSYFCEFSSDLQVRSPKVLGQWINPYVYFSNEYIWPRGFPIELIEKDRQHSISASSDFTNTTVSKIGVMQGLANGAPDVDALYRLVVNNSDRFMFDDNGPLLIPKGTFAPFNSQVTLWNIELLPLMYLPQTCTFRMTDIWRSFIATHLMHLNGYELIFTGVSAFQERNVHDLIRDFMDEVPGYLGNARLVSELTNIKLVGGMENLGTDLRAIYTHLHAEGFFRIDELECLELWLEDCQVK